MKNISLRIAVTAVTAQLAVLSSPVTPASLPLEALDVRTIVLRQAGADWLGASPRSSGRTSSRDAEILEQHARSLYEADRMLRDGRRGADALDKARRDIEGVLDRCGGHSARAHHLLATVHFLRGRRELARRHAARAAARAPMSSQYHSNLAFHLQLAGLLEHARLLYDRSLQLDPANTAAYLGIVTVAAQATTPPDPDDLLPLVERWRSHERDPHLLRVAGELRELLAVLVDLEAIDLLDRPDDRDGRDRHPSDRHNDLPASVTGRGGRAPSRPRQQIQYALREVLAGLALPTAGKDAPARRPESVPAQAVPETRRPTMQHASESSKERSPRPGRPGALLLAAALATGCTAAPVAREANVVERTALEQAVAAAERGNWKRAEEFLEPIVPPPERSAGEEAKSLAATGER